MTSRALSLLALLAALIACCQAQELRLQSVERKVSLTQPVTRVVDAIKVKNTGSKAADSIVLCYMDSLAEGLSVLKVTAGKQQLAVSALASRLSGAPDGVACYAAQFAAPLERDAVEALDVQAAFVGVQMPNPAKVSQGEPHLLEFRDNVYVVSPYAVSMQRTEITLPTRSIKSYSGEKGSKQENKVTFGRFDAVKPWTMDGLKVHYEHNKPFKQVTKLTREITVSHWGNIYVDEFYVIRNDGAEHAGQFSRLRYAHHNQKGNSFRELRAKVPPSAHSMYYRDLIGNISTSDVRGGKAAKHVDLELRYPLMGGWQVDFNLGYSLPLQGFLYRRPGGRLRLLMDFGAPIDDVYVSELEVRVVLPEGATNIQPVLPFEVEQRMDKKYTYLDTAGRPVVVLTKRNAISDHNQPFAIDYSFSTAAMLREPLLLVGVFAAFFAAVALYNRTELTISKDAKWAARQLAQKTGGALAEVERVLAESTAVVTRELQSGLAAMTSKDWADAGADAKARIEAQLKVFDSQVKAALRQLEELDAKVAERVREHAEKGRALLQRAYKTITDKADILRKGTAPSEAASKAEAAQQAVLQALHEWEQAGSALLS